MQVKEIECPSGLKGVVRKLKVADLDIFADRNLMKRGGAAMEAELVSRIWQETIERGPYVFDGSRPPWSADVLLGDRFYAIMQARILTRGSDYEFDVQCDNPVCRNRFVWGLDLEDLPVLMLSNDARAVFEKGNRFTTNLAGNGDTLYWSLPTGTIQHRIDKYVKQFGQSLSTVFAARLNGIEGKEDVNFVAYMQDLDINDFDQLSYEMERADCGIDTGIEVECPSCGNVMEQEVGFGKDFFTRSSSRRRSPETAPGKAR